MTEAATTLKVELSVRGMTCASCSARLERALKARPGVVSANVHLVTERALLEVQPGTTLESLCGAVEDAGFEASTVPKQRKIALGHDEEEEFARAARHDGWLLLASALLSLPLVAPMLLMAVGIHVHLPPWVELLLATPVQFVLGARFYVAGYKALRHGSGNMDLLVAIGTSAAYFFSVHLLVSAPQVATGNLYFEASAVVIALVRFGKWLEARAKRGTTAALRQLLSLQPEKVRRRRNVVVEGRTNTVEETVDVEEIDAGQVIVVRPGERFAADGIILEGKASIDESMVTGESEPVARGPGEEVVSGSLNCDGQVVFQVSRVGEDSTLGRIIGLVYSAQGGKANIQRLVDRVSQVFVPVVLVIALGTFITWYWRTGLLAPSLVASVSVLVIACPCALGLATPTAIVAGTGVAAQFGILVRDVDTLERASRIDTVVFDKTGTLTEGHPVVTEVVVHEGTAQDLVRLSATVEQGSLHPLASAVVARAKELGQVLGDVVDFQSLAGSGVSGVVEGSLVRVGSRAWLRDCGVQVRPEISSSEISSGETAGGKTAGGKTAGGTTAGGKTAVSRGEVRLDSHVDVARDSVHLGTLYATDVARASTGPGIDELRLRGTRSVILSGDLESTVERFAQTFGIDDAFGRVRPEEKQLRVAELQRAGRCVAMVGDGINDAPALAAADVGIAMGSGTQVAVHTANVVLMRPDLTLVSATLDVAKATFSKIRQNLFWAFLYNCIGIPLAASGRLSPMIAGLAMALSSVSVVTNSLLLRRWRPRKLAVASRTT